MNVLYVILIFSAAPIPALALMGFLAYAIAHSLIMMPRLLYIALITSAWVAGGALAAVFCNASIETIFFIIVFSAFIGFGSAAGTTVIVYKGKNQLK